MSFNANKWIICGHTQQSANNRFFDEMNTDLAVKICCCKSEEELESKRINDEIDRILQEEVKNQHTVFKLLLLGKLP